MWSFPTVGPFLLAARVRVGAPDLRERRRVRRQARPPGILVRDPVVEAAIRGDAPDASARSLQYRFLRATGLPHKTIRQIERAHGAASLLEGGAPISDIALELGYFDQAHLTNSLRRFLGETPAWISRKASVG